MQLSSLNYFVPIFWVPFFECRYKKIIWLYLYLVYLTKPAQLYIPLDRLVDFEIHHAARFTSELCF